MDRRPYAHLYFHHLFEKVHAAKPNKSELTKIINELDHRSACEESHRLKLEALAKIKYLNNEEINLQERFAPEPQSTDFVLQDIPTTHQKFIDQTANIHQYSRARLTTEYFRDYNSFVQERVFRLSKYLEAKEKKNRAALA